MKAKKPYFEQNGGADTRVGEVLLPGLVIGWAEKIPMAGCGNTI